MSDAKVHIMVVDDQPANLLLILRVLEEKFKVTCVESGQACLDGMEQDTPDLVLMDVMMPKVDGPTALQFLHDTKGFEKTPVIFITAKAMGNEIQLFKDMGALDVISKPYDPMTLCDDINTIWLDWCARASNQ